MRKTGCRYVRHSSRMEKLTDDELVAELIRNVAIDVLEKIGDVPEARYQFFREFIALATRTVERSSRDTQWRVSVQNRCPGIPALLSRTKRISLRLTAALIAAIAMARFVAISGERMC